MRDRLSLLLSIGLTAVESRKDLIMPLVFS